MSRKRRRSRSSSYDHSSSSDHKSSKRRHSQSGDRKQRKSDESKKEGAKAIETIKRLWNMFYPEEPTIDKQRLERTVSDIFREYASVKNSISEYKKRDGDLILQLGEMEKMLEKQDNYINTLKMCLTNRTLAMRKQFTDPLVNHNYKLLRDRLKDTEEKLRASQRELQAAEFSAESSTGRQLIKRCRKLQEENLELGRRLECTQEKELKRQLELQKEYSYELSTALSEAQSWMSEILNSDQGSPPGADRASRSRSGDRDSRRERSSHVSKSESKSKRDGDSRRERSSMVSKSESKSKRV